MSAISEKSQHKPASAQHLASPGPFFSAHIQSKLAINDPGDKYEQEADAMADHVMRSMGSEAVADSSNRVTPVEGRINRKEVSAQPHALAAPIQTGTLLAVSRIQQARMESTEDEEMLRDQRDDDERPLVPRMACEDEENGSASPSFTKDLRDRKGGGVPLKANTLVTMNQAFQSDFSGVRIHHGAEAADLNRRINARAFTHGNDVYFNSGQYTPASPSGKRLLAHELTHVRQQNGGFSEIQRDPQDKRMPKVEEGEVTGFTLVQTSGNTEKDIEFLKKITPDATRIWILTGTKLDVYNVKGGHLIQTFTIKDTVALPFVYLKREPDGFYIAASDLDRNLTWIGKSKPVDEAQKKQLEELDAHFTIENWFVSSSEMEGFFKLNENQTVSMAVSNLTAAAKGAKGEGGGKSEVPPRPKWMKDYEKELKALIEEKRALEPGSEDLPDIFAFYYSKNRLSWRGYAAQFDDEGKPENKVYLDIAERAEKAEVLERIRTLIRITALKAPKRPVDSSGELLPDDLLWAHELKLRIETLIAREKADHPTAYDLPDKLSLGKQKETVEVHLIISVYKRETNPLGLEETVLKSGELPDPLRKGMKPEDLLVLVRKATLGLRGVNIQSLGEKSEKPDRILRPFPSRIEDLNAREDFQTVTGGENEFRMILDMASVEGTNLLHLTTLRMRGIYFTWDVYKVDDQLSQEEQGKLATEWPDRRKQLLAHFEQSGQLETNPFVRTEGLEKLNKVRRQYGQSEVDPSKPFTATERHALKNSGIIYGQTTQLTPEAEIGMPKVAGDYLIFCRAVMEPIGGSARLPSEAFYPVRVVDGYVLAREEVDKPEKEIKSLEERRDKAETEEEKARLQEQLDKIAAHRSLSLKERTGQDLAETDRAIKITRKLKWQYAEHRKSKSKEVFVLTLLEDTKDGEEMLDVWNLIDSQESSLPFAEKADRLIEKLETQKKSLEALRGRIALFDEYIDPKKPVYTPVVSFVSEVTGEAYQFISIVAERPSSNDKLTQIVLVDVTTSKTQKKYFGESSNPNKEEAIVEATRQAFSDFGEESEYGEGYIYYRVPGMGLEDKVRSTPGLKQRVISILEGVALVAGLAALVIGTVASGGALGVAAVALGLGSAAIGAGLAIQNISERHENRRLDFDVELVLDILGVLGPLLAGARALASVAKFSMVSKGALTTLRGISTLQKLVRGEKFVLLLQRVELGVNIVALNYKVVKDLKEIEASSLTDDQKRAMQMQIMKHALVSGVMLAVSVRNEIKAKPSATEEMLNKMIAGAGKERYYALLKIKDNITDAEGRWTLPEVKPLPDETPGAALPRETSETKGKPELGDTASAPSTTRPPPGEAKPVPAELTFQKAELDLLNEMVSAESLSPDQVRLIVERLGGSEGHPAMTSAQSQSYLRDLNAVSKSLPESGKRFGGLIEATVRASEPEKAAESLKSLIHQGVPVSVLDDLQGHLKRRAQTPEYITEFLQDADDVARRFARNTKLRDEILSGTRKIDDGVLFLGGARQRAQGKADAAPAVEMAVIDLKKEGKRAQLIRDRLRGWRKAAEDADDKQLLKMVQGLEADLKAARSALKKGESVDGALSGIEDTLNNHRRSTRQPRANEIDALVSRLERELAREQQSLDGARKRGDDPHLISGRETLVTSYEGLVKRARSLRDDLGKPGVDPRLRLRSLRTDISQVRRSDGDVFVDLTDPPTRKAMIDALVDESDSLRLKELPGGDFVLDELLRQLDFADSLILSQSPRQSGQGSTPTSQMRKQVLDNIQDYPPEYKAFFAIHAQGEIDGWPRSGTRKWDVDHVLELWMGGADNVSNFLPLPPGTHEVKSQLLKNLRKRFRDNLRVEGEQVDARSGAGVEPE